MTLIDLVALSRKYGANPDYAVAEGGYTSWKDKDYIYIKGSGTPLADVDENDFIKMDREKLSRIWDKTYADNPRDAQRDVMEDIMDSRSKGEYLKRPNVEVLLHDIIPQTHVMHFYPALVNGITCARDGEGAVRKLFVENALWIAAQGPGFTLAASVRTALDHYRKSFGRQPELVFLENNGVLLAADSSEEIDRLVAALIRRISSSVSKNPDFSAVHFDLDKAVAVAPAVRMICRSCATSIATFRTNSEVKRLLASKEAFAPLMSALTPEHVVYCMPEPLFIKTCDSIEDQYQAVEAGVGHYAERNGCKPKIIAMEGLGFYACGEDKRESDNAALMFLEAVKICVYAESFGGVKFMDPSDIDFIKNELLESHGQESGLGEYHSKRAAEKIAIVTGGAQGFGKGIAERLAAEGANVVIADLNGDGAVEVAISLANAYGKGKSIAVNVDVADEASTKSMICQTVLEFGGLDLFINNAGINKPGGLEDIDVETFEMINKVNYTAYFLGTKYASRFMKIQHRFNPGHFMDIIQINSKTGLAGSNKNFSYAGSKFGGIGLTQSFALELVSFNIKVNAICPGNYFESPLWSDPVKGMFIQYLKSGKIAGAKTTEDVKRSYEAKVPMGRGCRPKDLANAVLYLMEQEYETGQAVPVTGGQIMLK